jgi:hypothetical protein
MSYNLTSNQQGLLRWMVEQVRNGSLPEEFTITWIIGGLKVGDLQGNGLPAIGPGMLDALAAAGVLICAPFRSPYSDAITDTRCTLTGRAYDAVDSNFRAPDTSFVTHLTPLADVTSLDNELKARCLPILGAGSADPKLWDSAVRTAGVILEERLRDVGGVADRNRIGRDLVNDLFGQSGTLAAKFSNDSERQGYRDLYAGVVGAFRNPYAHRLVDPTPEDGGAFIVFVNLLLKMIEDLR